MNAVEWFRKSSQELYNLHKRIIPAVGFVHIPPQETMTSWYSRTCYGTNDEKICCQSQNTGLFAAIIEQKNIKGLYYGHDHHNDFQCNYHDV